MNAITKWNISGKAVRKVIRVSILEIINKDSKLLLKMVGRKT
jgi:hypothetical protein